MKIKIRKRHDPRSSMRGIIFLGLMALATVLTSISDAGIGRTGIASGRITRFGSILVNNRKYEIVLDRPGLTPTEVIVEGRLLIGEELELVNIQQHLKVGQVVSVRGLQFDTASDEERLGTAVTVEFKDNVEGPIDSIGDGELFVLGQLILTDALTVVETLSGENTLDDLSAGDKIEISGFPTVDGDIIASRIEQVLGGSIDVPDTLEVTGIVRDLNIVLGTFAINSLTVDFSGAYLFDSDGNPLDSIPTGDDVTVEAQGEDVIGGVLMALQVEIQDAPELEGIEVGEFEGLITDFQSASSFGVGNFAVVTDGMTVFEGGGPANLTNNVSVEIFGRYTAENGELLANGDLLASRVVIHGTRIEVRSLVDNADCTSVIALGIPVSVLEGVTELKNSGPNKTDNFTLCDIRPGDYADIKSFLDPSPVDPVVAGLVVIRKDRGKSRLQGFVSQKDALSFAVQGVTIDLSENPTFLDVNRNNLTAADFFSSITVGTFVKISSVKLEGANWQAGVLTAEQIELGLDN